MKKTISYLFLFLFSFVFSTSGARVLPDGSICVYLKNGRVDVFPGEVLKEHQQTAGQLSLTLNNDSTVFYAMSEVDSLGDMPKDFARFTSFKFNNKYNDNVFSDVFATIGEQEITATVGAIGKSLTPSFQLSDDSAVVYVDGVRQFSKVSRHRFDAPVVYTIANSHYRKIEKRKVSEEIWSEEIPAHYETEKLALQADWLSTNAPSNYGEDVKNLVDNDPSTFFHSTWGTGAHQKLPLDEHPYIQVNLKEDVDKFVFEYTTSQVHDNRFPYEILVQKSRDGRVWEEAQIVNEGLPTSGLGVDFTSPLIDLKGRYKYLRFVLNRASYKNYFVLSRLDLFKVVGWEEAVPPHLIAPARYAYAWMPFGRDIPVKVEWLTDKAYNVPRIDIDIDGGGMVVDKVNYLGARFTLHGAGVFPDMTSRVSIKGRGNSSWAGTGKSPYRLKFATPVKPFGLTKGKNWVLLANRQTGSMLTNAIAMKVATLVQTAGANNIVPVELYINGEYRGSYNFTQHVGLHNNSVDIDETNAVLFELDSYYDEIFKFQDDNYGICTNIKDPDLEDIPAAQAYQRFNLIRSSFNDFTSIVARGDDRYEDDIDVTMFARYMLVNELVANLELKHPKSTYLYKEDLRALHSKYVFGPCWDFDWAFGYEFQNNYCVSSPLIDYYENLNKTGGPFFTALRFNSEKVKRACYREWYDFMHTQYDELMEYIDDYYNYARRSLEHNATRWGDGQNYRRVANNFKKWLTERAEHIFSQMEVYDLNTSEPITKGDINLDGAINLADIVCLNNYLLGIRNEVFNRKQADVNEDNKVSVADIVWCMALVMQSEVDAERHIRLPKADAELALPDFTVTVGAPSVLPVVMTLAEDGYTGTQFDVELPEGMKLEEISLPGSWQGCRVEFSEVGTQRYRVLVYSDNGGIFPKGGHTLQLKVNAAQVVKADERVVTLKGISLVSAAGEEERLHGSSACFDMEATGIEQNVGTEAVGGGKMLWVEALTDGEVRVYTVDGRLVKVCPVTAGKNQIALPVGVYIVNQQKVVINR